MNDQKKTEKKIAEKAWELLHYVDSFKILTVGQLSALSERSHQVIRRRLRALGGYGYISTLQRAYGNKRGRPEDLVLLSDAGYRAFHKKMGRKRYVRQNDKCVAPEFVEHELLVNWFLIHLILIERKIPQLSVNYTTQKFSTVDNCPPPERIIRIRLPGNEDRLEFIPDGIFTVSDIVSKKTLLFFLEIDRGTEILASPARGFKDVRQKILNYQNIFRSDRYKRYEQYFQSRLNGFRLLFVTQSPARLKALCQLTTSLPPSDFIWLSDMDKIQSLGLTAEIWIRGGSWYRRQYTFLGKIRVCNPADAKVNQ